MGPTVPLLRHAIHPASAPACNPPCLCSGMQHHQQEHTTHTLVACLCPGMQLLRLCSGMRPTLPLRWHAAAPLAHRLPALLWHATPPASALACNPPCLRSGMRPILPLLQHAIHPASAVASNLPQSGLSSSTSGYTHDPTRPLQHQCLVLLVQHDKPISTTTRQIRPCLPLWAKSLWSTQPLSHARTSLWA